MNYEKINMEKDINSILYAESMKVALRVDFLINSEELKLYAVSIYNASIWGKKIDKKNKALKKNRQLK
ncbi:hypothetical protein QR305_02053 [Bacteroides finegoldii]|uniref:Uncharacterized protein n=2 Tax=Bacteroides finegoldii TaxID=338188 RepID=K5CR10_9BACE|nr:hypothetical protein HMPREF1057_00630 [Bacteroides finegoldii CL09T03C10]